MATPEEITSILAAVRRGEDGAIDRLVPLVYDELRLLARRKLARRRGGQTLDTTALVHEVYLRLVDRRHADWRDRAHFLAIAATAMRHVLVDRARRRSAQKRGGDQEPLPLDETIVGAGGDSAEILALEEALAALQAVDERAAKLVELRFYGGLTTDEIAVALGVSDRTVKREWRKARAFLYRKLAEREAG